MAALCMIVVTSFLGLAVDVGQLRYAKRNLQLAADAAALAAGLEIRVCGSISNCSAMQIAAQNALIENGYTGSSLITNCSGSPGSGLTLAVNSPPCSLGSKDPTAGKRGYAEVVLSKQQPTYFARLLGISSVNLSARAEAMRNPSAPCIYALNPNAFGAITVVAGVLVHSSCAIVDESSDPTALLCVVGVLISAPKINVTGGTGGLLCGSTPPAKTGVPVPNPPDPLSYLPPPNNLNEDCGKTITSPYRGSPSQVQINILTGLLQHIVFNPGIYCGGIAINLGVATDITFNPGTYILREGGGGGLLGLGTTGGLSINITALSSITGTGVTFYNQGPTGGLTITAPATLGLSTFQLSAPTTGEYGGVLFYQPSSNTSDATFLVSLLQGGKLEGAVYLPKAQVSYGVSAISSAYNILVADKINFVAPVASLFGNDYSALDAGSPLGGDDAVLVQ